MSIDTITNPTDCFHNLIKRVKESGAVQGVRFIKAMGEQPAEKPVKGYIAVCEVVKAQYESTLFQSGNPREFALKHRLKCGLKLMGKKHSSAYDLQKKLDGIIEAVIKADKEGYVVETETRYARYDKDSEAIFQQLYIFLEVYAMYENKEAAV